MNFPVFISQIIFFILYSPLQNPFHLFSIYNFFIFIHSSLRPITFCVLSCNLTLISSLLIPFVFFLIFCSYSFHHFISFQSLWLASQIFSFFRFVFLFPLSFTADSFDDYIFCFLFLLYFSIPSLQWSYYVGSVFIHSFQGLWSSY